jgi:hypothetical protein
LVFYPQGDGQTKRTISSIWTKMWALRFDSQTNTAMILKRATDALNNSISTVTKRCPKILKKFLIDYLSPTPELQDYQEEDPKWKTLFVY